MSFTALSFVKLTSIGMFRQGDGVRRDATDLVGGMDAGRPIFFDTLLQ